MASPPDSPSGDLFDPSAPFKGVVVCCTSIPPEQRTDIAQKTAELGGIHKYDLTPDVTHLIVGEYDTPKYRHVARERPDIRPMAAGWIEAVRDLWVQDADIDFGSLEDAWRLKTFETGAGQDAHSRGRLLCCLTGFDDGDTRQQMIDTLVAHGADYTGDLTRKVTHLIVHKPEGKKYAAARSWGVHAVAAEWLRDSVARGMILDEKAYDPVLPVDQRGRGAWTRREVPPRKRPRDAATVTEGEGRRKLRKTASIKLSSQRDNMWGDILGRPPTADPVTTHRPDQQEEPTQPIAPPNPNPQLSNRSFDTQTSKLASFGASDDIPVFSSCCFFIHGFPPRRAAILAASISSLGGLVAATLDDVSSSSGAQVSYRFVIVPQDSPASSHPTPLPPTVTLVTEFFVERCMHKKSFSPPSSHVLGRPFPVFPIPGFSSLTVSTAGFTGVDLHHVDRAVRQLGASYDERFRAQTSVLVCASLSSVRKQKLDLALQWRVPVVDAAWLWACVATGARVPVKRFLFRELRQRFRGDELGGRVLEKNRGVDEPAVREQDVGQEDERHEQGDKRPEQEGRRHEQEADRSEPAAKRPGVRAVDTSAFAVDKPFPVAAAAQTRKAQAEASQETQPRKEVFKEDSITTADFHTAPTHPDSASTPRAAAAPLSEASSDSLNRPSQRARDASAADPADTTAAADGNTNENLPPVRELLQNASEKAQPADKVQPAVTKPLPPAREQSLKASDRLALSARLTTLLDNTVPDGGATTSLPPTAAAAAAAAPAPHAPGHRRRRQILGRAVSNVSAASSGSADTPSASGLGGTAADDIPNVLSVDGLDETTAEPRKNKNTDEQDGDRNLSLTQLQYEDPEAEAQKERLRGSRGGRARTVEKVTLASAGGYASGLGGGGRGGAGAGTGAGTGTRRSRR